MEIYKTRQFKRWADQEGLGDERLRLAVREMYGFAKNELDNIGRDEEAALKKLAATLLKMPAPALARALDAGEVMEVKCDA